MTTEFIVSEITKEIVETTGKLSSLLVKTEAEMRNLRCLVVDSLRDLLKKKSVDMRANR